MKKLIITEKPSVANQYAEALDENMIRKDGYIESAQYIITWCVGHLVTMSYPEQYDIKLKSWNYSTLPIIPTQYRYEVISRVRHQYSIVKKCLNRKDVNCIYYAGDSGREGEYIQRLIREKAGHVAVPEKRIWINSMTQQEILRGIQQAKSLNVYEPISSAAHLRAIEDWLIGINFSRAITICYGNELKSFLAKEKVSISIGRVMTCVLGMIVVRDRNIRAFNEKEFFRIHVDCGILQMEWRAREKSTFYRKTDIYQDFAFLKKKEAERFVGRIKGGNMEIVECNTREEKQYPPLLYNLADMQNECAGTLHISPDKTLLVLQELYEEQLISYPRTDARVLSTAVAGEVGQYLKALEENPNWVRYVEMIMEMNQPQLHIEERYVNDGKITDHYAIIPTGKNANGLSGIQEKIYTMITKRFLCIFYPPALIEIATIRAVVKQEYFYTTLRNLKSAGFHRMYGKKDSPEMAQALEQLRPSTQLSVGYDVVEGRTSPPEQYNSGSLIMAMEHAGKKLEDIQLRSSLVNCGIGTSATRADIIRKLVKIGYIELNEKTQRITSSLLGELVYEIVLEIAAPLLDIKFTAQWEHGLNLIEEGKLRPETYRDKLYDFIYRRIALIKGMKIDKNIRKKWVEISRLYKSV